MRALWLAGCLMAALALAVVTGRTPAPRPVDAPAIEFSAGRAMVDVRDLARAPHPVGSAEHARVRGRLLQRMGELGLNPTTQTGPLSEGGARRLARWGTDAAGVEIVNLIGVLAGTRPDLPAVLLMAHYDTVDGSPGAPDDTTGVAALLETVRALKARGPRDRDVIVLITDSEELDLGGARAFFGGHPLRDRVGFVINLEARGGGGRALMFQTGPGNAATVGAFAAAAGRADGGATSNALAVFVYDLMPNDTDFTVPRERGTPGLNFAFIGRPHLYHSPEATPDALDEGSVQHIGSLTLEAAHALSRSATLPGRAQDVTYADLFGVTVVAHAPAWGWLPLAAIAGLLAFAWISLRPASRPSPGAIGIGALEGARFLAAGWVLASAVRLVGGPALGRAESAEAYYTLLARLPWMEAGVTLAVTAVGLAIMAGVRGRWAAVGLGVAALAGLALGGLDWILVGAAVVGVGLGFVPSGGKRNAWGPWLGLIGLGLLLTLALQIAAPTTAFVSAWPTVLAALAAALTARLDPEFRTAWSPAAVAVPAALAGAWLMGLGHLVFLGVGMDLPGVLAVLGLFVLMLIRPLAAGGGRGLLIAAAVALALGVGLSGAGRWVEAAPSAQVG